jgi:predicted DCC family thiol-disulfide oxidoreductase YuxK
MSRGETERATPRVAEVWYDGECPVCRREIGLYRGFTDLGHVDWRDVSDPAVPTGSIGRAEALRRFHVRLADGRVVAGAAAFIALWRDTRHLAWLARLIDRWPLRPLFDLAYSAFLAVRPLWYRPPVR